MTHEDALRIIDILTSLAFVAGIGVLVLAIGLVNISRAIREKD